MKVKTYQCQDCGYESLNPHEFKQIIHAGEGITIRIIMCLACIPKQEEDK